LNAVNEAPEPIKLVADKVLEVLFHDKFADCNNAHVPFPINICPDDKVVEPVPP
jgi:hypothetical protein